MITSSDKLQALETGYFLSPNSLFDKVENLSSYEKLTYLYLCRCCNNGKVGFPSYNTIAKVCNFSKDTAIRAVKGLLDKNCIVKQKGIKGKNNLYIVNYKLLTGSSSQRPPELKVVAESDKVVAESDKWVVAESDSIKNYVIKKKEEEKVIPSSEEIEKHFQTIKKAFKENTT